MLPALTFLNWTAAFLPIVMVLLFMMVFRWSGGRAGGMGWLLTCVLAFSFFGADLGLLAAGSLKGLWTTVFILYIIWGAMALYNVVDRVGGFKTIAGTFTSLTRGHRTLQLLVIGWAFPSFLQGVCGFGTPVAVAAPLLVGLGFSPVTATAAALLGHAWAVTFGSLGSSYGALLRMTGLSPDGLALWSSLFLGFSCMVTGLSICFLHQGRKGLREGGPAALTMALAMGGTLILVANWVSPFVGSVVAGVTGLVVGGLVLPNTRWYRSYGRSGQDPQPHDGLTFSQAFTPYYLLVGLVLAVYLTPLKKMLSQISVGLPFPRTATLFGFTNQATGSYAPIKVLTTPGTLIFISVVLSIGCFACKGLWKPGYGRDVVVKVVWQAIPATVTVMTMSMMAVVMMESGMTVLLAEGTAEFARRAYPVVAPFIGVLGAFMTGSNTSSNILFGAFQRDVAGALGISTWIIASLQTTGGALGNAISPMNVALGTGVTGIAGREGEIIKKAIGYSLAMAFLVGLAGYLLINVIRVAVP